MSADARLTATATARNRDPICEVLRRVLPATGVALEIASGTGEHIRDFAAAFPALAWQPSDPSAEARASIAAWTGTLANVRPPLALDAAAPDWPIAGPLAAILCINMIHISPWAATTGLLRGAGRLLAPGAPLYLYGPYLQGGSAAPSNLAFDADLRRRDPRWGLRAIEAVLAEAAAHGLVLDEIVAMPAHNLSVVLRNVYR